MAATRFWQIDTVDKQNFLAAAHLGTLFSPIVKTKNSFAPVTFVRLAVLEHVSQFLSHFLTGESTSSLAIVCLDN